MKKKFVRSMVLPCLFVLMFCSTILAYGDPLGLYRTSIPESWIYQGQKSNENLSVFYGDGDYDLLYFENLGSVLDQTVELFCARTLEMFGSAGGLKKFKLESSPERINLAGELGLAVAYTYEDDGGAKLWEYRIFLLLPSQRGFTLTLGGGGPWIEQEHQALQEILTKWRWLF